MSSSITDSGLFQRHVGSPWIFRRLIVGSGNLLVDEILAVGDFAFQKKCIDRMVGYKKNGVTIVYVSHSMDSVKGLCDRVVWIDNHMVKMIGDVPTIVQSYLV